MSADDLKSSAALELRSRTRSQLRQSVEDFMRIERHKLEQLVGTATIRELLRIKRYHRKKIVPVLMEDVKARWEMCVEDILLAEAVEFKWSLPKPTGGNWRSRAFGAAIVGTLLMLSPLAAIPLAGLAVRSGKILYFFSVHHVSIPILVGIIIALVIVYSFGAQVRGQAINSMRSRYLAELGASLDAAIGQAKEGSRSMLAQLLAMADAKAIADGSK